MIAYELIEVGGELICELRENRVIISGKVVVFAVSELMM